MSKYINADKFKIPKGTVDDITERGVLAIYDLLDIQPSVNVVEIVRCKNCKHYKGDRCLCEELPILGDDMTEFFPDDDFFCKYGERKETEEDNDPEAIKQRRIIEIRDEISKLYEELEKLTTIEHI